MNTTQLIKFKSPTRVDWDATANEIANQLKRDDPNIRTSELAMSVDYAIRKIKAKVYKHGVSNVYRLYDHGGLS